MRVTTDDGVGLEVSVSGQGPPLVMVHGFPGAKEDFTDQVPALAEHATVVTFDLRGHGESDKPETADAYSLDRLALDTLQIADGLGFERFRLLEHSMGGMVVRRAVLHAPDRIEALVLMDTTPGPPDGIDPDLANAGAVIALEDGMEVLREILDEMDPLGTPADRRLRAERPGYVEYGRRNFFAVPPVAYATLLLDIVHQPDELEALRSVSCPALVIVGEQDEPFLRGSRAMAETIPGAELVVIPNAGHSPQLENPPAWLDAMERFLARVDTGAAR